MIGRRIVNTRATWQAEPLNALLRERGAIPVEYPCIAFAPPDDLAPLDAALRDLAAGYFAWLVLTSANTAAALAERIAALRLMLDWEALRVVAVGEATAAAARDLLGAGRIDWVGASDGAGLALVIPVETGTRVLLPESTRARGTLAAGLAARGAETRVVAAYQTMRGAGGADVPRLLASGEIDALTFTSSSTVTGFLERLEEEGGEDQRVAALRLPVACLGAPTAATARAQGFSRITMPEQPTLAGMVAALARVI